MNQERDSYPQYVLCSMTTDTILRDLNICLLIMEKRISSVFTKIWINQPEGDHIPFYL